MAFGDPGLDFAPLAREEVADRAAEPLVRDVVGTVRQSRIEAAQPLVLAAGAGLKRAIPLVMQCSIAA